MRYTRHKAKALGRKFYDGAVCAYGHATKRYTKNNGCVECCKKSNRRYRKKNKEYFKAYQSQPEVKKKRAISTARWARKNPEKMALYRKRSWNKRRKNKKVIEQIRKYRQRPHVKQRHRERLRANYARNRDRILKQNNKWRLENFDKWLCGIRTRRARRDGAVGSHTVEQVRRILIRQRYLCANPYCKVDLRKVGKTLDHKVPVVKGGSNFAVNLQWLCKSCNSTKHKRDMNEWLESERLKYQRKFK